MKDEILKFLRYGFLAGLLIGSAVGNMYDFNMLWSCIIGFFGGAAIGALIGLIKGLIKRGK